MIRRLILDEAQLRRRFYDLSHKLHPDRFAQASDTEQRHSLRWTTLVNRAYQILRDQDMRTRYVIDLTRSTRATPANKVPVGLAERYFELRELLSDPSGVEQMKSFRADLVQELQTTKRSWQTLAQIWEGDQHNFDATQKLEQYLHKKNYLESMISDLDKNLGVKGDTGH